MAISTKLKRVNKGILLGIVALLGLIGYFTVITVLNYNEQSKIEDVIAEFTAGIDTALISPESAQSFDKPISSQWVTEKQDAFDKLTDKLYAADVTTNRLSIKSRLASVMSMEKNNSLRVLDRKTSVKVTSIRFRDNKAYVDLKLCIDCSFRTTGELSYDYSDSGVVTSFTDTVFLSETAVLEKTGSIWRIRLFDGSSIGYTGDGYIDDFAGEAA